MINSNFDIEELKETFKNRKSFLKAEIALFYQNHNPNIQISTIKTRISRLITKGIISRTGWGIYTLGRDRILIPLIDDKLKTIYIKIQSQYPDLKICLWHTSWFSQFMVHQPAIYYTIVETESDRERRTLYSDTIFRFLQSQYKHVFHKPNNEIMQNYATENRNSIIVLPLVSEAPLQKCDKILTVTLEKMLVDIYCDENLFAAQQDSEKENIYKEAFTKYTINISKLLRYAVRRNQKKQISEYLNSLNLL
jgi:hypothetical protein